MPKLINRNTQRRPTPSPTNNARQHSTFSLIFWCAMGAIIGLEASNLSAAALSWFQLFLIVIIGGHIGNFLNLKIFPARLLALITSTLVLFVAIRMGIKLFL